MFDSGKAKIVDVCDGGPIPIDYFGRFWDLFDEFGR